MAASDSQDMAVIYERVTGISWLTGQPLERRGSVEVPLEAELNLFRLMLSRIRTVDSETRNILSRNLTALIVRDFGLRKLLTATFDFDETSQHVTTLDQRFMALAHLVASPPVTCCPLSQYFDLISPQINSLMTWNHGSSDPVRRLVRKLSTIIVNAMIRRNKKSALKSFVDPLISSLRSPDSNSCPHQTIEVICGLTESDFDLKLLVNAFPALLYADCTLSASQSPLKSRSRLAVIAFLKQMENSVYLLDDALFNHYDLYSNRFHVRVTADGDHRLSFTSHSSEKNHNLEVIVPTITHLLSEGISGENEVDFCILLLQRWSVHHIMSQACSILLCTLTPILLQKTEHLLAKHPRKWIQFLKETLSHLSQSPASSTKMDPFSNTDNAFDVRTESMDVALRIIRTLVSGQEQLSRDDIRSIRESLILARDSAVVAVGKEEVDALITELADLEKHTDESGHLSEKQSGGWSDVVRDLNDPLMPTRAHGLITLKRLIESGDQAIHHNWKRVMHFIDASLADNESYVFLQAINTLSALSITHTDQVLPVLMKAFQNTDRSIQERLNVGEVIVRTSRRVPQSLPEHAHLFLRTFMSSLKDTDELLRVSSISNLAHFCSGMGPGIEPFLSDLFLTVESLVRSDGSQQVKRAGLMFMHMMLTQIDGRSFDVIRQFGRRLHSLVEQVYRTDDDDVCRLHAQLALEEMDRIANQRIVLNGTSVESTDE